MSAASNDKKDNVVILKTWQFFASQVILFLAIATFCRTLLADFKGNFYSKEKGEALAENFVEMKDTVKELNKTLQGLQIFIAREVRSDIKLKEIP